MNFSTRATGSNTPPGLRSRTIYWVGALVIGAVFYLLFNFIFAGSRYSSNRLAIGADYAGTTPYQVKLVLPADAQPLTFDEILSTRKDQMEQHQALLGEHPYKPFARIFQGIDPSRSWMSLAQLYFFGTEQPQGEVPPQYQLPAASTVLLNPLLLIKAEFWGLSIWGGSKLKWNPEKATLAKLAENKVPLAPRDPKLTYFPDKSRAEARYAITDFIEAVNPYLLAPLTPENTAFALSLQNARDFGFGFFYLDLGASEHIQNAKQPAGALENVDYIGSIPTTWARHEPFNHLSANNPAYDWIVATSLPAKATIKLWYNMPQDPSQPADFTYEIDLI